MAAHVPHLEVDAPGRPHGHLDLLRVEALGGDRLHELLQLEPVEQGGLAGRIEPDHHHVQRLEAWQEGRVGSDISQLVPHDCSRQFTPT